MDYFLLLYNPDRYLYPFPEPCNTYRDPMIFSCPAKIDENCANPKLKINDLKF